MWGDGTAGQLGVPLPHEQKLLATPQTVEHETLDAQAIIAVALGHRHTLCLTQTFEVIAWGSNEHGQLGITSAGAQLEARYRSLRLFEQQHKLPADCREGAQRQRRL